jgi:murein L,D-transpeptidase YcbB/YkuD
VAALRQRLTISGDLDANAGGSDIYDSYVEAGVRRFQARHGLNIDGIVREQTASVECAGRVRLAQLAPPDPPAA